MKFEAINFISRQYPRNDRSGVWLHIEWNFTRLLSSLFPVFYAPIFRVFGLRFRSAETLVRDPCSWNVRWRSPWVITFIFSSMNFPIIILNIKLPGEKNELGKTQNADTEGLWDTLLIFYLLYPFRAFYMFYIQHGRTKSFVCSQRYCCILSHSIKKFMLHFILFNFAITRGKVWNCLDITDELNQSFYTNTVKHQVFC